MMIVQPDDFCIATHDCPNHEANRDQEQNKHDPEDSRMKSAILAENWR